MTKREFILTIALLATISAIMLREILRVNKQIAESEPPKVESPQNFSVLEERSGPLFFYTVTEAGRTNKTIFVHTAYSFTLTLFRKD